MSKATPREWYLNFGTTLGCDVRTKSQFENPLSTRSPDYQEAAIHVIEKTPEVAKAVELFDELVDQIKYLIERRCEVESNAQYVSPAAKTKTEQLKDLLQRAKAAK